ncbi:unnamed protein product [Rhizophagus irregularis]|nr:unnamed protein product [Rhizophagus irregularis]CAB5369966.1 unnamed protein product [Rhizophagus irregularis]
MSSNKKTSRTLKWKNILRKNPQDYLNEKEKISKIDLRKENIRNKLNVKSNLHGPLKIENFTKLKSIYLEKLKLTDLEIINCPQLTKIDLSELSKLKSLFVSNCSRLTKLDISHSQLIELTDLDVSNLIELNCSNTSIKRLSLNLCPNIIKLICSNNNKLDNLDISNCLKLGYLDCSNNSKLTSLDISSCPKDIELIKPTDLKVIEKEEKIVKIKNILIIGCTGSGKSTLASALTETEGFKESEYGVSKTKHFKKGVFEWKGTKYRVIDTTGVGSTGLSTKKVSNRIAEGIFSVPLSEGINQVLLVVGKNFTDEINTLRLFESDIFKCTTIVRTKFSNFKNQDICEKDKEKLCEESEINAKIIKSCKGIIYVDNPPINILEYDDDDDNDDKEVIIRINKGTRKKSRTILLDHLEKVCQEEVLHMEYDASTNATGAIQPPNSDTEITDDDNTDVDYSTDDENTRPDHFTSLPSLLQPITINHRELQPYHITKIAIKGLKFIESDQQVIEHLKLNHGLLLDGQPSKQAIFVKNGELSISLYNGQPIVYTEINKSTELCINFPIAEVAYKGGLLKSFSKYDNNDENLYDLYGHFFTRKTLIGGKLFLKSLNLVTSTQMNMLKYYLFYVYNLVKCSIKVEFNNLFTLNLLPKIVTMDGEELNTHEEFYEWINNLYQKHQEKLVYIISYNNLIPISQLRNSKPDDFETCDERQSGIVDKEKLILEDWVGNAAYDNLICWTKDFNLFHGLMTNQNYEMEISKKIAMNFIKIPKVNLSDKFYLKMIRPSTKLEVGLISSNIFPIENLGSFPFIKIDGESYEGFDYILVKSERYEILLDIDNIKPTKEFEQVIEEALNSMKPLKDLQHIFNEYGHLFSRRIILGRSLKIILPNSSDNTFENVNDVDEILKSLNYLNVSYLLTQNGENVEIDNLSYWIEDMDDNLEVIEFDNNIPLYKILKEEQQKKIDNILDKFNDFQNFRIIMTGITDLKDLEYLKDEFKGDLVNVFHYKRINLESSLKNENYKVYGSIISENNAKLEEIYVNFGQYDVNGFYAIIKKLKLTNIDITKCYISWIIIGIPSQLSVFSPNNRELQVDYIKKSIKLQPNEFNYNTIDTCFTLYEGYTVFVHAHHSSTNEPKSIIKLVKWSHNSINFQISQDNLNDTSTDTEKDIIDVDLHVCIPLTSYKSLRIDNNKESECFLIGYILTRDNFDRSIG